jgi:hypothetical protein
MTHVIDHTKGQLVGAVSAQWASRPDDQKFLSLSELRGKVAQYATESRTIDVLPQEIVASYDAANPSILRLGMEGCADLEPTHWGFDQIARVAGAPASYLRELPGPLAALNLNYGLKVADAKPVQAYVRENGTTSLRGITSTKYGRILDRDVADAVINVAGNGTGDTRWKVPGVIEWGNKFGVSYNPNVDITRENTTLYASDRDLFIFLVDDLNPIEVGKLANGQPDLMFRGFYVWNSEVGSRTYGFASMYLRGVCQNRNLWGVEGFNEIVFKHTSMAPERFEVEAEPALVEFAGGSTDKVVKGVAAAKKAIAAKTDEERLEFLGKLGFSQKAAKNVIDTSILEEQRAPESLWDFAQGISAVARKMEFQDARLKMEAIAGAVLDKVAA